MWTSNCVCTLASKLLFVGIMGIMSFGNDEKMVFWGFGLGYKVSNTC